MLFSTPQACRAVSARDGTTSAVTTRSGKPSPWTSTVPSMSQTMASPCDQMPSASGPARQTEAV
jgi:hypothetical protein